MHVSTLITPMTIVTILLLVAFPKVISVGSSILHKLHLAHVFCVGQVVLVQILVCWPISVVGLPVKSLWVCLLLRMQHVVRVITEVHYIYI